MQRLALRKGYLIEAWPVIAAFLPAGGWSSGSSLSPAALPRSGHVLLEPVHEELGDFSAVLLGHELVAIAAYPDIFQVHVRRPNTCLIQPLGHTMGVRMVIAPFSGHIEDGDTLQVNQLVRGLLLNEARDKARPIRPVL